MDMVHSLSEQAGGYHACRPRFVASDTENRPRSDAPRRCGGPRTAEFDIPEQHQRHSRDPTHENPGSLWQVKEKNDTLLSGNATIS